MPIILLVIWFVMFGGWVLNVVQVVGLAIAGAEFTTMFILKIVGIPFGPLGCVLGWVGI